ncbi:MAG: CcoQ/FixQ family Cbb3-type cytochrome c oxidase assembly chaperone [Chitinophagaceae bacterium]|nr:MAG: CcoQ/FixQ family Cbb3-type cytochrome c oxidase assembly chaperone [Chitinophagaceae bacterium]
MFKFIQQYAEKVDNIEVYPMISLLVFFIFFVVLLYMVITMDKKSVQTLSNLPFQSTEEPTNQTT